MPAFGPTCVSCWIAAAMVAAIVLRAHAEEPDQRPVLHVIVDERSTSGAAELGTARTRAGYLFADAGIRIVWSTRGTSTGPRPGRDAVALVVMDRPAREDRLVDRDTLGFAIPGANRVYVYYQRIEAMALNRQVQPGWFLGVVIAHELAHVLVPDLRHTTTGVMAAMLTPNPIRSPAFTPAEARAIRARLGEATTFVTIAPR